MCEQLGREPNEKDIPPDLGDFPYEVQEAFHVFSMLGDRVYPDIGYVGKDYTNLPIYLDIYGVEDRELFLEILHWLDQRAVQKSAEQLKREMDKIKRQSRGKKPN